MLLRDVQLQYCRLNKALQYCKFNESARVVRIIHFTVNVRTVPADFKHTIDILRAIYPRFSSGSLFESLYLVMQASDGFSVRLRDENVRIACAHAHRRSRMLCLERARR